VKPQPEPSQVAVAFAGAVQGEHALPQLLGLVSAAQVSPQAWKPGVQTTPQRVPSQVAELAFAGTGQAVQDAPQVATLVSSAQASPQAW